MADMNDFFFQEDFDAILDVLEKEEELEEEFSDVVTGEITCDLCHKKCKSQSGLKRHKTVKHKNQRQEEEKLSDGELITFAEKAKMKIMENRIFNNLVNELKSYTVCIDEMHLSSIKETYSSLLKSADAEKFYSSFYSTIVSNAEKVFLGISRTAATLLSTKMADLMLAHSKRTPSEQPSSPPFSLCKEERAGMQYIGGYVLHKLYNKHLKLENKSHASEQTLEILKAARVQKDSDINKQQLISALSRGGLWTISEPMEVTFEKAEFYFICLTSQNILFNIDMSLVVSKTVNDIHAVAAYKLILFKSELIIDSNIAIQLYVTLRSFSFAKDVIQRHKIKAKVLKSKALRKDLNRSG